MKRIILFVAFLASAFATQAIEKSDTLVQTIDSVVITGARNQTDIRHLPMTLSIVNRTTLEDSRRLSVLPTLSEQVPGLFVSQRAMLGFGVSDGAAGGINLRGISAGSGRMMVLIDGHPQYQGIFGHSISDAYQTMIAERVEVLRGPASTLYGSNAMGGVVNIVTRKVPTDGMKTNFNFGVGSYGTIQTELTNRLRSGRFSSIVAGQYARSDNHRPDMDFEQYGGYAKIGYDFSDNWTAYTDIDLTHFNASYPGSTQTPVYGARQWITRGVATAVIENHYGATSGALSFYHNFGRHKINDGFEDGETAPTDYFRSNDALTGVSWYQSATLFAGNRLTLGFDYQHIYGKAWNRSIATGDVTSSIGHNHENEIAGYVDFRQDLLSWLTIDAGVRVDNHSQTGTTWIPQGGAVARFLKGSELKAMVSKGFRNPTIREMYFWRPANAELLPESIINYELSWRQRLFDNAFSYGLTLYYLNGDNMIQTQMVDGRPRNVNTGAIENTGAELDLRWRLNRNWSINSNYSLLHMHNPVVGAPRFKGWIGAEYGSGRWNANGGLQYIDGLYTQTGTAATTESFVLLNLSLGYKASNWLTIWAKGENLLAQNYEINYGYPMPRATFMAGVSIDI